MVYLLSIRYQYVNGLVQFSEQACAGRPIRTVRDERLQIVRQGNVNEGKDLAPHQAPEPFAREVGVFVHDVTSHTTCVHSFLAGMCIALPLLARCFCR